MVASPYIKRFIMFGISINQEILVQTNMLGQVSTLTPLESLPSCSVHFGLLKYLLLIILHPISLNLRKKLSRTSIVFVYQIIAIVTLLFRLHVHVLWASSKNKNVRDYRRISTSDYVYV